MLAAATATGNSWANEQRSLPNAAGSLALAAGTENKTASPLAPEEALRQIEIHPLLKVELAAAEPQIVDPVAIRFDEDGRMWVAEMRDYPHGPEQGEPPRSRIRVLQDADEDGYYETARVFADELLFLNGLQPWKGGVMATLSGEVAWLGDIDGDGRADVRETWFSGFKQDNPQLRANHPTLGLDNHVYVTNGLRGGTVVAKRAQWSDGAEPVSISGMDFRFHPRTGRYAAVTGNAQFGLTFDDFGSRFLCSNRNPCIHVVLEDRYLGRNPYLAVPSALHDVSPPAERSRVHAVSRAWTTSTLHAGQFTSACGVTLYRGNLLPSEFYGNSFTCEPTGNLVHRDVLSREGPTFSSRYGREGVEFLATRDEWFRPVNLQVGPDGALYVVDMYRAVIEHPQFMPNELRTRTDLHDGHDRGRVYRIVPASGAPEVRRSDGPELSTATGPELVALLGHSNSWHRETAARLLLERRDRSLYGLLEKLTKNGATPQSRVHALWALEGLGELDIAVVRRAFDDRHPRVRETGVRLAERWIADEPAQVAELSRLVDGADPRLRFQIALSVGEAPWSAWTRDVLIAIAHRSANDRWTRTAILSSSAGNTAVLLDSLIAAVPFWEPSQWNGLLALLDEASRVVGAKQQPGEIASTLTSLDRLASAAEKRNAKAGLRLQLAVLNGLGNGLNRRGDSLQGHYGHVAAAKREQIFHVFRRAVEVARSADEEVDFRQEAIRALRHADYDLVALTLKDLVRNEPRRRLRVDAIEALAAHGDPEIGPFLVAGFSRQTPAIRRALLGVLFADSRRVEALLDEIEAGHISTADIDPVRAERLSRHPNAEIRHRAERLFAQAIPADRQRILQEYQKALSLQADPNRGRAVFEKHCSACHRIGGLGVNVAPDIGDSRVHTPQGLLTDILDPNRAIDSNYFAYSVVTTQGKQHTGVISAETATSITLKQQDGKTVTLLRQDIEAMRSTGVSLMPVGLEKNIDVEQMADLISYIKNWRYMDGVIPIEIGK